MGVLVHLRHVNFRSPRHDAQSPEADSVRHPPERHARDLLVRRGGTSGLRVGDALGSPKRTRDRDMRQEHHADQPGSRPVGSRKLFMVRRMRTIEKIDPSHSEIVDLVSVT